MRSKFLNASGGQGFSALLLLFLFSTTALFAQSNVTVSGTVTDALDGTTIPGVSVVLKGNETHGIATDFDGKFSLEVPENSILQISCMGYDTQEVELNGRTTISVQLESSSELLGEVVLIGYGTQKKDLTTGANLQLDGDLLQKQSTVNALQAMQGQAAGVQITSTSGQPGESLNVVIRGLGTTGDNSPLYIVDGVQTSDISYLNNSDIETISILKDAASAAIYGSQAANGVVLVSTKKGKAGKAQITFDSYYGIQTLAKKVDLLNATEYMTIMNESAINSGNSRIYSDEMIASAGTDTDWMDKMFQNASTQNYTVGVSGGSEKSTYSSSLSYLSQEGIVGGKDNSFYERYNFRFNSEHKLYKDRITFGENFSFAWINNNGIGVGDQYNNALRPAFQTNPLLPMYDENGNYFNTTGYSEPWLQGVSNPYAQMVYSNQNGNDNQKLVGNVYLDFKIIENLKFRTSLGIDYYAGQGHSYTPEYNLSVYSFSNRRSVTQYMNKGKSLSWDNLLTYSFDLGKEAEHQFEAMLGTSSFMYDGHFMSGANVDVIYDDLENAWLSTATNTDGANIALTGGPENEIKRMSYFGRINYNYLEKYMFNATFRADGSSQFAQGNRWGYFPSFSAGWVLTREDFMQEKLDWLGYFKLRASWGQVGNQNVGNFQYLAPIKVLNTNYTFGTEEGSLVPGAYLYRLANEEIQWETAEEMNIGFDARLFNSKLNVNFDWYKREQKNWLVEAPILATAGADAPWMNGGSVINSGVELAISYKNSLGDDFNYNLAFNGAYNKNEVGRIPTADGIIHGIDNQLWDNSLEFYRAENGHPMGYFWGYKTGGVFQTQEEINNYVSAEGAKIQPNAVPGDLILLDLSGDGLIDEKDKTEIGDPNPDFTYGFSIGANYKAWDFSMQANGVVGNQLVQAYRNMGQNQNWTTEILDRWHGPGSSNTLPRVTTDNRNYNKFSDLYVKDGDFLRINTITLGFDFAKIVKKENLFASQLRMYFSVLNLHTFTTYNGMDPEVGFGPESFTSGVDLGYYPRPRTFMMGLNVKF